MKDDMTDVWKELNITQTQLATHKFFTLIEQEMNVSNDALKKLDFMGVYLV